MGEKSLKANHEKSGPKQSKVSSTIAKKKAVVVAKRVAGRKKESVVPSRLKTA